MRELFLSTCQPGIWLISVLELVLIVLLMRKYMKEKSALTLCALGIGCGLFIDGFLISLGTVLPVAVVKMVSPARFIAHGMLVPLIFPICAYGLQAKGKVLKAVWGLTILVMAAGLAEALATKLEVKELAGVVRAVAGEGTPGWAEAVSRVLSFGTVIPLMIAGVIVWVRTKRPELFLGGFLMFAFSALGPATGNADLIFYISMFGELLMLFFFWLYTVKTAKK